MSDPKPRQPRKRHPLAVIVTWTDAVSEPRASVQWEFTPDGITRIGDDDLSNLVYKRTTRGLLGYIDAEKVKLFKDYDEDGSLGNSTTIPLSWVTKIATASGKVLYVPAA